MGDQAQQHDWLEWEGELRDAIAALRAAGGHERVLRYLDDRASLAMHNAYCSRPIPFAGSGLPPAPQR
jgi:hypothetical protein